MARFYQAILRDDGDALGVRLRRCFVKWAGVPDDGAPTAQTTRGRTHVRIDDSPVCGRYVTEEQSPQGTLRTTITWATPFAKPHWVTAVIDGDPAAEPDLVDAPAVVADFLMTGRPGDGAVPLEASPHLISTDELDQTVAWLAHPARRVPVVVLTPDPRSPDLPAQNAARLAEALAGIAVVVRLYDHRTQEALNDRLGDGLEVFGGGLRTYLPDLRPGAESYPRRHPVRGGKALRELGSRALDVVISGVTDESVRRPLPDDVRQAQRIVNRIIAGEMDLEALSARVSVPTPAQLARPMPVHAAEEPPVPEPEEPPPGMTDETVTQIADGVADRLRGEILAALQMTSGDTSAAAAETLRSIQSLSAHVSALRRELDETRRLQRDALSRRAEAENETEELRNALDGLRAGQEQLELEYEQVVDEERRARERVRWLEGRLAEHGEPVYGVETPEEPWSPESLVDVVLHTRAILSRVDLPDRLDDAAARLDVDHPRECRVWASKAWDAFRALHAYAEARASDTFHGGFFDWCTRPPPGKATITLNMLAMKESETVTGNARFREARTFPVPETVAPGGKILMEAHIKLRRVGSPAPRIYFLDDAAGETGRIWVGYLGEHLANTRTN